MFRTVPSNWILGIFLQLHQRDVKDIKIHLLNLGLRSLCEEPFLHGLHPNISFYLEKQTRNQAFSWLYKLSGCHMKGKCYGH